MYLRVGHLTFSTRMNVMLEALDEKEMSPTSFYYCNCTFCDLSRDFTMAIILPSSKEPRSRSREGEGAGNGSTERINNRQLREIWRGSRYCTRETPRKRFQYLVSKLILTEFEVIQEMLFEQESGLSLWGFGWGVILDISFRNIIHSVHQAPLLFTRRGCPLTNLCDGMVRTTVPCPLTNVCFVPTLRCFNISLWLRGKQEHWRTQNANACRETFLVRPPRYFTTEHTQLWNMTHGDHLESVELDVKWLKQGYQGLCHRLKKAMVHPTTSDKLILCYEHDFLNHECGEAWWVIH